MPSTSRISDLRRALAEDNPGDNLYDLAVSLHNLGVSLAELGRQREAQVPLREAAALRARLA